MDSEVKFILKRVFVIDIIIAVLAFIISYVFYKPYDYIIIVGLILAAFNFVLNAISTSFILSISGKKFLTILISAFRIIITLCIVIILCGNDKFKYIAIIIGYTLHYIAVILHGLTIKK
ncbi:ATP synthase protein I [Clostridium acidisoli DSM 12555]|uniref:ATP synthase protein I n=1 Tax=Clostridium acidisoli DSM 12555 TaxID=1121291 RepID=A0A1W1XW79_9CLOT|nr:ATP synthase protein I [Clostridium acidisoli DSM 12555]